MESGVTPEIDRLDLSDLPGRKALDIAVVRELSHRSDGWGLLRIAGHVGWMVLTGVLVWSVRDNWWLLIPAMALHGFAIVAMFAPMHECVHRTAFQSRWLNEVIGWLAGACCFYNHTFYRLYHTWHHRHTQDVELDPELSTPKPRNFLEYVVHLSGIPFWFNRPLELISLALGGTSKYPFIPASAKTRVVWSIRGQLFLYLCIGMISWFWGSTAALVYWLLPAMLAQPLLRAILIVEHTGCSEDNNGLTNTRTTLTSWPIRFLMWNMPYHAEHHLYPSIPFHCLPRAHQYLVRQFSHIAPSYPAANKEVIQHISHLSSDRT